MISPAKTLPITASFFLLILFLGFCAPGAFAFDSHKPFDITSDVLEYDDESQVLTAQGHVVVIQGTSTLHADLLQYDRQQKHMHARGSVVLRDKGSLLMGEIMNYDLATEHIVVEGGKGFGSPWYFQGENWEKRMDYLVGKRMSFTSCELVDTHYHVRSSRVKLIPDRIFWAWNNVFYDDEYPIFYSPFLYKSLGPRRVVVQVQPGDDSVKGAFAKTQTTIRLVPGVYDKVLVDYYTNSGTGFGNEFNYSQGKYKGSLFGYYIDPKGSPELVGAPSEPQYNFRWYHWQQVTPAMTFQSNVNHRKNVSFNNQFFAQDTNQSVTDVNNSVALSHTHGYITQRLTAETFESPDPNSDPLFGDTFVQSASLPRYDVTFYQVPIWSPKISTSTLEQALKPNRIGALQLSGNGSLENSYQRLDEQTRIRGNASTSLSLPINLARNWSLSTGLTPSLKWQDKYDPFVATSSTGPVVIPIGNFKGYQARAGTSANLRYRPFSALTLDQTHGFTMRFKENTMELDRQLQDGGIETHHLNWLLYWRPSRYILTRSYSGYDLRQLEDESLNAFRQRRIDPWTNEVTIYQPHSTTNYFFRHQTGYYPTRVMLWEGDIRWTFAHRTRLESGLSYNASQRGMMTWNNRAGFYFSPSWRVDGVLNSQVPSQTLHSVTKATILQSEFIVTRNIHCWDIQFIYRNRPPFTTEYSFLINLRLGTKALKEITNNELESQFYPWRADNR